MAKKVNIKQERAILVAYGCTEHEIIEYFLIFRDMRTPNFSLKDWEGKNSEFVQDTINLLKTEYVSLPRDLSRFLKEKSKKSRFRLKRRKPKGELKKQIYFFIKSRHTTKLELIMRFLTEDQNIPLSDSKEIIREFKEINISGYTLKNDSFIRDSDKEGIDGIQIEILDNSKILDFTEDHISIGSELVKDENFFLAMLPLLSKSISEESDLVEYANNIYTTYIGLKYGVD